MAIVDWEGWDCYSGVGANVGIASAYSVITSTGLALVTGLIGGVGQAVQLDNSSGATVRTEFYKALAASYSSMGVCFHMKAQNPVGLNTTTTNNIFLVMADSAGVAMMGLGLAADGAIHVYRLTGARAGTSLGNSGAGSIAPGTTYHIEFAFLISDTVGTVSLKIDTVSKVNLTSQDTRNGTPTTVGRMQWQGPINSPDASTSAQIFVDNVYYTDSVTTYGPRKVNTRAVVADTAQKDFTASTGTNNAAMVDELPVASADYVQASTVGNTDRYTVTAISGSPTIEGQKIVAFAQKTDATARSIALQCKSGATTSDGSNYSLPTGVAKLERIMLTDPNTAAAWTAANASAIEVGPKVTV